MNKGIQAVYSRVWGSYELINSILTLGLDARWRKKAARLAVKTSLEQKQKRFLDICSGTGQTALNLSRRLSSAACIIAADFSLQMTKKAAAKTSKKGIKNILFVLSDAVQLPFDDNSFDVVYFNSLLMHTDHHKVINECLRVLKPKGKLITL